MQEFCLFSYLCCSAPGCSFTFPFSLPSLLSGSISRLSQVINLLNHNVKSYVVHSCATFLQTCQVSSLSPSHSHYSLCEIITFYPPSSFHLCFHSSSSLKDFLPLLSVLVGAFGRYSSSSSAPLGGNIHDYGRFERA